MDNDVLRKKALVKYLNSLSVDKLIDIVKEIISNHIDAIYSREILEVVMQKDDDFNNKINDIDKEEIFLDYYRYKKELAKYRYINVYECYDYDEYEDEEEISIRYNPKIETLINGCYFFLLKLLKMHRYKEAINIILRMKAMQVTIYEDEYIENDYEYIDVENEDDLDELSEGNFVSKINYLHLAFKESDMQDIDLKLAYVSKNPALAIAKSLCEYDFYDTDLSFLINEYKLDVEQVNTLLFQIEKELFYIDKTKLINLFIPVGRLTIDLSSFFVLSYELIDKNKDMYYAFDSSNSNTILKYAPLFLDEDNNSFISLARIIFEATLKEDDENLILKYAQILYKMSPDIYLLIYIIVLNKNRYRKRKSDLYIKEIKRAYVSIVLGEIDDSTLEEFEQEKPLGWRLTMNNELLTLLKYMVASNSKSEFKDQLLDLFVKDEIISQGVVKKYFLKYLKFLDSIQVDKNRIVKSIEILSQKRMEGIVFNKYRHSYFKAARLLKDLMILQSDDLILSTDYYVYINKFNHYPAFIKEFKQL